MEETIKTTFFGNIAHASPLGTLSPEQALELASIYMDNSSKAKDPGVVLVLCHDTDVALFQAKRHIKPDKNPILAKKIAKAYVDLGHLLMDHRQAKGAQASFRRARRLGASNRDLARSIATSRPSSIAESLQDTLYSAEKLQYAEPVKVSPPDQHQSSEEPQDADSVKLSPPDQQQSSEELAAVPSHIFAENIRPPMVQVKLPEPDTRLDNTSQLVCCLALLKMPPSSDVKLEPIALKWMETFEKDKDEQERLRGLATDVIRVFKEEKIKDAKVVAEVVCLAPVLDKETFHDILREFCSGIRDSVLLDFQQLEGLAQLIQGADHGHLDADDLIKILQLLSTRLKDTHKESSPQMCQLAMALSNVLDAMVDTKVTGLDRVKIQEPLFSYLSELKKNDDPFLEYQAAYAHQALLYVPNDESMWQAARRRTLKVALGVSGLVSAVNSGDPKKFVKGLKSVLEGISGESEISNVFDNIKSTIKTVTSMAKGFKKPTEDLKEGLGFGLKHAWYPALREADAMIRAGELGNFKELVCEASCRRDPAFQWGLCQRLGEMAANPKWDGRTRRNAIAFLGEIYKNDKEWKPRFDCVWKQRDEVKKWILNILMQLSSLSEKSSQLYSAAAEAMIQELEADDPENGALCRECRDNDPIPYPLKVKLPELASPSLLDRVQNKLDVEGPIRILRRQRTKEPGNAVYVQPQAKSSLQAADDTRFLLMDKVKKFLESGQKVFLLLGDSGAGKSAFCRELELDLWRSYMNKTGKIPLHINLPTIDKPELDMIAKQLKREGFTETQIREMKCHRKFILICDGYDESQQTRNLYTSNRLNRPGEWVAQMVISCSSEYLGSDYQFRFQPGDRNQRSGSPLFQEAVITPFSTDQIHEYIKKHVSVKQSLWCEDDYKQAIDLIPNLKDMIKNPFMMTLSLEVLPRMMNPGQHISSVHITRVSLYDHFVEQWLERGKMRLAEKDMIPQMKAAFEKLSAEGFTLNGIGYLKKFAAAIYKKQGGHPVVEYSQLVDEGSWKDEFFDRMEKQLLHETCPLKRNGNQHQFIHQSLLEYGLALAVFDPQDRKNREAPSPVSCRRGSVSSVSSFEMHTDLDTTAPNSEKEPDLTSPLVWRCFVNDYSLLQFLVERVQQEPVFKVQLLSYIEHSKKDKKWRTAAANAITILVRAGVQFVGTNLRGIQIPGADLSYGVFDSVRLQDADMRKVNFQGAWLRQTYLSRSDMTGAQFGDQPCLDVEGAVMSCASSPPDGESLVLGVDCGDIYQHSSNGHSRVVKDVKCSPQGNLIASCGWDGTIRLWDAETGICQGVLRGHEKMVSSIAFTPQGDQICSGGYDSTAQLWDVDTGTCQHFSLGNESTVGLAKGVCRIAHSPQGDQVAFASGDSAVDTWNATTREHSGSLIGDTETKCSVYCAVYSPDGNFIATACADRIVRLWNVETKSCINTFIGHSNTAMDVVFSPQGNQLASASADCTVRLWSVELGECSWILIGHSDAVARVAYSHKGDLLASGSSDKTVRLWDIATGQCRAVIRNLPTGAPGVTWIPSSDADYLVTSCEDGSVLKWQVTEVEGQCHVNLCWAATSGSLTAGRALIQDVRGLTPLDKQLLKQRGAYDVPENLFREPDEAGNVWWECEEGGQT